MAQRYHIGTLDTSPVQNATIGGICFPRYTEEVRVEPRTGETIRSRRAGDIVELDAEKVARGIAALDKRVVRWTESRARGTVYVSDTPYFRPHPQDEPLAKHVYLREVPDHVALSLPAPQSVADAEAFAAVKRSEQAARSDPEDAARRQEHRGARARGEKLDPGRELGQ